MSLPNDDGGFSWNMLSSAAGFDTAWLSVTGTAVYANAQDGLLQNRNRLLRSTDGGTAWVSSSEGLPAVDILDLRLDPFDPDTLYAGTDGGSVYVYTRRAG